MLVSKMSGIAAVIRSIRNRVADELLPRAARSASYSLRQAVKLKPAPEDQNLHQSPPVVAALYPTIHILEAEGEPLQTNGLWVDGWPIIAARSVSKLVMCPKLQSLGLSARCPTHVASPIASHRLVSRGGRGSCPSGRLSEDGAD